MSNTLEENVLYALETRRSIRSFLNKDIPLETVERILKAASRAPSGTNIQPWHVHVVTGDIKKAITDDCMIAHNAGDMGEEPYGYYPPEWTEPYISRRKKLGLDMYSLLGIEKGDRAAMAAQMGENYTFFGAPVGLFFTIENHLDFGSWFDYGTFFQNIMTAARGFGLSTCPQQAFAKYHSLIQKHLEYPDNHTLICGMSLGWEDTDAKVNQLKTERVAVSEFANFHGYK